MKIEDKHGTVSYQNQKKLYETYKNEPLFWAGLMLYCGKGDLVHKNQIRLASGSFSAQRIFVLFCLRYLGVTRETLRCSLLIENEENKSLCLEMWANVLTIKREGFYKTQYRKTVPRKKQKRLHYGIATIIITNTALKKTLLTWLSLAEDERFEHADMV